MLSLKERSADSWVNKNYNPEMADLVKNNKNIKNSKKSSLLKKWTNIDLSKDTHETSSQSRSSRVGATRSPGSGLHEAPTPAPFEGESSINTQSDYAREMLAQVIGSTPSIGQNEEVKTALTALSEMVSQQSQITGLNHPSINRSLAEVDSARLERPPWAEMCNALEKAMG